MPAPYFITGPVGASKTSTMVNLIVGYLNEGRPVATNIDLYLEYMPLNELGLNTPVIRLPEEPRSTDLDNLGYAYPKEHGYDESKNGGLFIDETAFFLNSREWQKRDRQELINWFRLVRKRGWNAFLAVQDIDSVDKQVINSLCRSIGWCYTSDSFMRGGGNPLLMLILLPVRVFAKFFIKRILGVPRIHMCTFYSGKSVSTGVKQDTVMAKGLWLYRSYDTKQEFHDGSEMMEFPVKDKEGQYLVTYRDPKTKKMIERYVHRDAICHLDDVSIKKEIRSVDMRAPYSILPAKYIRAWYPADVSDGASSVQFSLLLIPVYAVVALAVLFKYKCCRYSPRRLALLSFTNIYLLYELFTTDAFLKSVFSFLA
ncbi:zonular occludens toxin domain-containing protein [Zobellella denitrificans]|uniref:zonular occludens toxin domain-containing protein n=1 Tax=Zobellella denitrificans TaxID=347534 RepID=UPI000BBEF3A0|nr:zonular occludens toxin domain-containing protein [Zobellella denitrificans]